MQMKELNVLFSEKSELQPLGNSILFVFLAFFEFGQILQQKHC